MFEEGSKIATETVHVRPNNFVVSKEERTCSSSDGLDLFIVPYKISKKQTFVNEIDENHGTATFVYWFHKISPEDKGASSKTTITSIPMYCMLRSGGSSIWTRFLKFRDKDFGPSVAKSLLDPKRLVSVEMINLLGNNIGEERVVYKNRRFTKFDIMSKIGIMKKYKSLIHPDEEDNIAKFEGSDVIATKIPWEIQVGQLRVPIKKNLMDNNILLSKIFPLLHYYQMSPTKGGWEHIEYLKFVDPKDIPEVIEKLESEFSNCLSDDTFEPTLFKRDSNLRAIPAQTFAESTDIKLVRRSKGGNSRHVKWNDVEVKCGSDIKVEDLIQTIKNDKGFIKFEVTQYFLEWSGGPFQAEMSIFEHIEVNTITDEGDTIMKLGKDWIQVTPDFETHLITNHKFIHVLKEYLVTKEDDHKSAHTETPLFPLLWNTGKKEAPFSIEEIYSYCKKTRGDLSKPPVSEEDVKEILKTILCKEFCLQDGSGYTQLFKRVKLNSSILPNTVLGTKITKQLKSDISLENFSKLLASADNITDDMIREKIFDKQKDEKQTASLKRLKNLLSEKVSVCRQEEGKFIVENPYITNTAVKDLMEKTGNTICLNMLIQFLRSQTSLEEGDYNELYHLSNCPCHSNGWAFIVGDRILCGSEKIELFDVMAYHEEKRLVYMIHVKEKADASAARAACSQVRVCGEEMTRCLTVGMDEDILDLFYKAAVGNYKEGEASIHTELVHEIMLENFKTKKDFNMKLRGARFRICLALADTTKNGASRWRFLKETNLDEPVELEEQAMSVMIRLGYISSKKRTLTQKIVDSSKGQITNEICKASKGKISLKKATEAYDAIFKAIKPEDITSGDMREMLHSKYITKTEINSLHDGFIGLYFEKVVLKIMPIPC